VLREASLERLSCGLRESGTERYIALKEDPRIMIDASKYDEKVREMKKLEFIRLLHFLGAKTVDMDIERGENVAKRTIGNVTAGADPTTTVGMGGALAKNSTFAEWFKINIENQGEDPHIRRLENFVAENDCSRPDQLLPFFKDEKYDQGYIFIEEEVSWLQMAYHRVVVKQSRVVCHVKYESSRDQSISANASALAGIFSVEAEKYSEVAESVIVKYAVYFHGEEEDAAPARRDPLRSAWSSFSEDGRKGRLSPLSSTRNAALVNDN